MTPAPDRELEVRCFPRTDTEFAAYVTDIVARCRGGVLDGERLVERVTDKLRERYPNAVVSQRTRLGSLTPAEPEVWYVYRDGRAA